MATEITADDMFGPAKYRGNAISSEEMFATKKPAAPTPQTVSSQMGVKSFAEKAMVEPTANLIRQSQENTIMIGKGMAQLKNGVVQLSLDALEEMGLVEEGFTNRWTQLKNEEKALVEEQLKEDFGDSVRLDVLEAAGQYGPTLAVPMAGQSGLARIIWGALTGAGIEGIQYQQDETKDERRAGRIKNATVGASVGGGASAGLEVLNSLKNTFRKSVDRAINLNQKFAQRGIEVQKRTGVKFKLSQLVDDPSIEALEQASRSGTKGERMARSIEDSQPKQVFQYFQRTMNQIGKKENFAARVNTAFNVTLGETGKLTARGFKGGKGLLGIRQRNAAKNFRAAEDAGGFIVPDNTIQILDQEIARLSQPGLKGRNQKLIDELSQIKDEFIEAGGQISPMNLQDLLQEYGQASKGTGKIFTDAVDRAADKRLAKQLFGALNDDLDSAIQSGREGAEKLKIARDQYALDTAKIRELEDSALGSLFGTSKALTKEDITKKLLKMDASEINSTMKLVEKVDPNIKRGFQRFYLEEFMTKASRRSEASAFPFIPGQLRDINNQANREKFKAIFDDPITRKAVMDGLDAVARVVSNNARTGGQTVSRLKNLAGVLVSQDATFASRLAADLFTPEVISKIVLDKRGVTSLNVLSEPFNQNRWTAALLTMNKVYQEATE